MKLRGVPFGLQRRARAARAKAQAKARAKLRAQGKNRSRKLSKATRGAVLTRRLRAKAIEAIRVVRVLVVAQKRQASAWNAKLAEAWKEVLRTEKALANAMSVPFSVELGNVASPPTPGDDAVAACEAALEELDDEITSVKEWA